MRARMVVYLGDNQWSKKEGLAQNRMYHLNEMAGFSESIHYIRNVSRLAMFNYELRARIAFGFGFACMHAYLRCVKERETFVYGNFFPSLKEVKFS